MENEKRLIDKEPIKQFIQAGLNNPDLKKAFGYDAIQILAEIEFAPVVDAVEVVHAEWACVNESDNVWMCTGKNGCGNEILLLEGTPTENGFRYCPNCGAKMDGGNEDG